MHDERNGCNLFENEKFTLRPTEFSPPKGSGDLLYTCAYVPLQKLYEDHRKVLKCTFDVIGKVGN